MRFCGFGFRPNLPLASHVLSLKALEESHVETPRFLRLFDVFSRRQRENPKPVASLTKEFRNRLIMFCIETFGQGGARRSSVEKDFWEEAHEKLRYLVGRPLLSEERPMNPLTPFEDTANFLVKCHDAHVLDFIEYIFHTQDFWRHYHSVGTDLIEDIDHLFLIDKLPYALTSFDWKTERKQTYLGEQDVKTVASFPQVIRRDDQVTHAWSIGPTLTLLRDKQFASANQEFLKALEDYRKGDFGDCLTKCCCAFESTMKLICDRNGWAYSQNDTAQPLLDKIFNNNSRLDSFFKQPLLIIATLRNRLGAHGAGTQQRTIPQHFAKYAINATAAAILLLVEECL